jgi:hypothetical protein
VTIDDETEQILSQVLNISFDERKAKRESIIMRKEIIPFTSRGKRRLFLSGVIGNSDF